MRDALTEIFTTLAETVLLVGIVILLLMGSFRTALVPLVTIPISHRLKVGFTGWRTQQVVPRPPHFL